MNVSEAERNLLQRYGYRDDDIDIMSRPEAEAELANARGAGIMPANSGVPRIWSAGQSSIIASLIGAIGFVLIVASQIQYCRAPDECASLLRLLLAWPFR
jgi:hypothetical protein